MLRSSTFLKIKIRGGGLLVGQGGPGEFGV
jgi:hypothetical protein